MNTGKDMTQIYVVDELVDFFEICLSFMLNSTLTIDLKFPLDYRLCGSIRK